MKIMASRKPKYISSLDLNFLDIKFKSLKQDSFSHASKKGSKNLVLPSLNTTDIRNDTSIDATSVMPTQLSTIPDNLDLYEYIQEISKMKESNAVNVKSKEEKLLNQNAEKYRKKIRNIKKQNELLHKFIIKLYYEQEEKENNFCKTSIVEDNCRIKGYKNVKNLRLLTENQEKGQQEIVKKKKQIRQSKKLLTQNNYEKLYENLYQDNRRNERKEEFENLKKKIVNNNFDKSLEAYLMEKKMRIPQFIRKLR